MVDGDQRVGVGVALEHLTLAVREVVEQRWGVGSEPRERREVVRPGQDVHGIDLHDLQPVHDLPERGEVGLARFRPRLAEALGVEGDATGLRSRDLQRHTPFERLWNRVKWSRNARLTLPVGPLRCLPR